MTTCTKILRKFIWLRLSQFLSARVPQMAEDGAAIDKSSPLLQSENTTNYSNQQQQQPHRQEPSIEIDGRWFRDVKTNRIQLLRGVNLGGNTKLPAYPPWTTHEPDLSVLYQHRQVSFRGRPFPLEECDQHLLRLRQWGFLFLRFQITWEALEHSGPGCYDEEYMDYVGLVLRRAGQLGFKCFVDPHQDVWSRFTGGSGAPGWTLELVGLDMRRFADCNAAYLQNTLGSQQAAEFPKMIWASNYLKLAAATMFTLFFGGQLFAPRCVVDVQTHRMRIIGDKDGDLPTETEVNIQQYLQDRFLAAIQALIERLGRFDLLDSVVIGYDTLNEPSPGFLGCRDIRQLSEAQDVCKGLTPTPLQAMLLGQGQQCTVAVWDFTALGPRRVGRQRVTPTAGGCWLSGYRCVWEAHGVYDGSTGRALQPEYFYCNPRSGQPIDWTAELWLPFVRRFGESVRQLHPLAIMFLDTPVNRPPPRCEGVETRVCYAPHWYDGITLMNKHFSPWWTLDYVGFT
jgi:hypothetical protein